METLKLMLEDLFIKKGYIYKQGDIVAAAEYIEMQNKNGDTEEVYTPEKWFKDTQSLNPEKFITKTELMDRAISFLIEQKEMCIDQSGLVPCIYDFEQGIASEDFINDVGIHGYDVTLDDIFNFLIDYYRGMNY